jgi:neutral ceramidase
VQALRNGGAGLVGLPGEFFVVFGLELKWAAPFPVTLPVCFANQGSNYHPTGAAYEEGGHEVMMSTLAQGSSETLVAAALDLARSLVAG